MREGDRVIIRDGSEANGDHGVIWRIQENHIILVQLDEGGGIWPVTEAWELEIVPT